MRYRKLRIAWSYKFLHSPPLVEGIFMRGRMSGVSVQPALCYA